MCQYRDRNVGHQLWLLAKTRAAKKGVPFDIAPSDIFVPEFCPILGIRLERGRGRGRKDSSPTLDRFVPELGYVRGNIAVISGKANTIKSYGTAAEHTRIAEWMRAHRRAEEE